MDAVENTEMHMSNGCSCCQTETCQCEDQMNCPCDCCKKAAGKDMPAMDAAAPEEAPVAEMPAE